MKASEGKFRVGFARGVVPPEGSLAPLFFSLPSLPATFLGFPLASGALLPLPEEVRGAFLAFAVLLSDVVPPAGQLSLCCPKPSTHRGETSPARTRTQRLIGLVNAAYG